MGVIQPILVRKRPQGWEVIAGERRWRAAKLAGCTHIPAIVRDESEERAAVMALVENLQRKDLNPMEEAEACARLQRDFRLTQAELAHRLGKKRSTVANLLRLLTLPGKAQEAVRQGIITLGHAKALLALPTEDAQLAALEKISSEGWSVRAVEALAQVTPERCQRSFHVEMERMRRRLEEHLNARVALRPRQCVISFDGEEDFLRILENMGIALEVGSC